MPDVERVNRFGMRAAWLIFYLPIAAGWLAVIAWAGVSGHWAWCVSLAVVFLLVNLGAFQASRRKPGGQQTH